MAEVLDATTPDAAGRLSDAEPGRIAVVGGGIAGVATAAAAAASGCGVDLFDRGRRLGGRLAAFTLRETGTAFDGHVVDVGASYFTVSDPAFRAVVDNWCGRGLARPWTDAFHVADSSGLLGLKAGPMRYAAPGGLRSLVEDLADGLPDTVRLVHPADVRAVLAAGEGAGDPGVNDNGADRPALAVRLGVGAPGASSGDAAGEVQLTYDAIALCGPDPQVSRLLASSLVLDPQPVWEPAMVLTAVFDERCWPDLDGVFVNDDAVLTWIADDGRRRGNAAPVLVAHSTAVLAAAHLADPVQAAPAMLAALLRVLKIDREPTWFTVKRWTFARPLHARAETHVWDPSRGIGAAGDAWCASPRTEAAWMSGTALGRVISGGTA